jgi:Uma2 family endonuclease
MAIKDKTEEEKFRRDKAEKTKKEKFISKEEYLDREAVAETKSEYHNGKIVAMAGAQEIHNRIVGNLIIRLGMCLLDKDCQVYPSDFLLYVPECDDYFYPDITVVCDNVEMAEEKRNGLDVLLNPKIVIEVSSKSTAKYDLSEKMQCYLKLASLQNYVIVSSESKLIIVYTRDKDGDFKVKTFNEEEVLIGECKIKIEDIYRKIGFEVEQKNE